MEVLVAFLAAVTANVIAYYISSLYHCFRTIRTNYFECKNH